MIEEVKDRIFAVLDGSSNDNLFNRIFHLSIMALISLNVLAVVLETVESLSSQYVIFFKTFELFSVSVFTLEYLFRMWTCTVDIRFHGAINGRIRFAVTPFALVDLMAVLPFYVPMFLPLDLRFIRALRLFRLFRILKMGRYSESLRMLGNVLREKKEELLITIFGVLILLVITSSLMYFIENEAQPDAFSSIPAAMWWGVATLTTVGYGDVYPVTPLGKFLGAIIALLGIGTLAVPAGILTSGFAEKIQRKYRKSTICPHCRKEIDEPEEKLPGSKQIGR